MKLEVNDENYYYLKNFGWPMLLGFPIKIRVYIVSVSWVFTTKLPFFFFSFFLYFIFYIFSFIFFFHMFLRRM
jgi:hypothetical protein